MGIQVEFNPDLALREYSEFLKGARKKEECVPERMMPGQIYSFLKKGQRNYWLDGEIPLVTTQGNQQLSRPVASVVIIEATHILLNGEAFTKGKYQVKSVFDINDPKIHFENMNRVK
jgi:hypothetical protein